MLIIVSESLSLIIEPRIKGDKSLLKGQSMTYKRNKGQDKKLVSHSLL